MSPAFKWTWQTPLALLDDILGSEDSRTPGRQIPEGWELIPNEDKIQADIARDVIQFPSWSWPIKVSENGRTLKEVIDAREGFSGCCDEYNDLKGCTCVSRAGSIVPERHLTPRIRALALAAARDRILPSGELHNDRLCVLADALEDAGFDVYVKCRKCRGTGGMPYTQARNYTIPCDACEGRGEWVNPLIAHLRSDKNTGSDAGLWTYSWWGNEPGTDQPGRQQDDLA